MPAPLENLSLRAQLRVDRLPLRLGALFVGLTGFGISIAMLIRAGLGAMPWDVLQVAIAERTGFTVGTVIIVVSLLVLAAWIPLRQHPGIGTLANAVWVGIAADLALAVLHAPDALAVRIALLLGGIVLNAVSSALYIGAQLGPGPRDGLMTGVNRRWGLPIGRVRLGVEVTVIALGWLLGGPIGVGTVLYAVGIGPLVQRVLPFLTIPVRRGPRPLPGAGPAAAQSQ